MMDAEIAAVLASALEAAGEVPPTPRGDAQALREVTNATLAAMDAGDPEFPNVLTEDHAVTVGDGSSILARWYTKAGSRPGSAVLYLHGGGMICGSVDLYDGVVAKYVEETGVPFLSVDYRLAPEHPGTTLVTDSHSALTWLVERGEDFGVDPARVAVLGDSGGGGVAAGVAIAAREARTPLAAQILIYPMLDDRNVEPDAHIAPFATWTYDNNYTGWHALLGDDLGTERVSPLAAPARLSRFDGLAPAFIDVGDLDIFRDENIAYARNLLSAGVPCELHVRPGSLHAFDRLAPNARVSAASWTDRCRAITAI
ncbi:alpha/beta hydrolase [Pseudarthrobacter sp. NPDC058196]|uniref:alpha/beta hydrolase n=1 Tax=Pseudarthrobacter sp. NPDC058196 TaxID=3346376 RepID=UPI0036DD82E9